MKTIYLADDDEDDRMLIREAIEHIIRDVQIIEVENGENLLAQISEVASWEDPVLILMDMNMPRKNGLETLDVLKTHEQWQHIPVLMMSTNSDHVLINQAYEQGINAYLVKPVDEQEFTRLAQAIDICFLQTYHAVKDWNSKKNLIGTSIVVIEDNDDHRVFIRKALQQSMPEVIVIELSDEKAVTSYFQTQLQKSASPPHLVLLDLYFPTRQKGLDLLVSIRESLALQKLLTIPLIVFSNSDSFEDIKASYQHKANAYMVKGLNAAKWGIDFKNLHNFWWKTVSYSKKK